MLALIETTKWDTTFKVPNHIYLVEGTKCLGYIKSNTKEPIWFKNPWVLDKRNRTFIIRNYKKSDPKNIIQVKGSKGDTYEINIAEKNCSCSGFKFRGNCKHLKEYLK